MAAITTLTVGSAVEDINAFEGRGLKSFTQIYAATSIPDLKTGAKEQHVCYAQLTGAMTINAATVVSRLNQFDVVWFHFSADGTNRVVTFGTNFKSSGTLTVTANQDATAVGIFDGTNIKITNREVSA